MKKLNSREMDIVTERNRLLLTWINLHARFWFAQHIGWLALRLVGSAISFRWNYLRSFSRAISKMSKVREARRIERSAIVISDKALAQRFADLVNQPGIYVVEDEQAEKAFSEMTANAAEAPGIER